MSLNAAARHLREPAANLSRYRAKYLAGGEAALSPGTHRCGRPPKFTLAPAEADALQFLVLERESLPLAVEDFVQHPQCSPETRARILAELDRAAHRRILPSWPRSLRRAGHVGEDIQAHFRGRKHAQPFEIISRRGMHWVDETGVLHPMAPGSIRESDDMSLNEPFRYIDPETGSLQIGRQTLCSQDVFSAAWLGASPIGRQRDAYRLEDIADHLRDIVLAHGLPLIWRFERGPWENSVIDGVKLEDGATWGGLGSLCHVVHGFKSRSKGLIESSFDHLQAFLAHTSTTIGRERGEFERATKLFLKAGQGDATAAGHFWDITAAADGMRAAMERFNQRPKVRRAHGREPVVPADLYAGAELRPCPPDQLWRFCPVKRAATVRAGRIEISVPHYPLSFPFQVQGVPDATGQSLYLEHGYSVLIAFHPGHPEHGCHVFNAERGVRNRAGYKFGQLLCVAPFAEDAPQVNLHPTERAHMARRNANAAVRSEFRAITQSGNARPGRTTSKARDGWGNAVTRGETPAPAAVARPAGASASIGVAPKGSRVVGTASAPAPARRATASQPDPAAESEARLLDRLERELIDSGQVLIL